MGDFEAEFSKTKTLGAGVRIFNGAVRAEREFPLKILFLACIRGFVVLLILRNGDQNLLDRSTNTISVFSVSKYFRIFFQSHVTDKFKFQNPSVFLLIRISLLFSAASHSAFSDSVSTASLGTRFGLSFSSSATIVK